MKNKVKIRRTMFIYLLLHTAAILTLVLFLMRSAGLSDNPFLTAAVVAGSVVLMLYTAYTINQSISDEVTSYEKGFSLISSDLQTMLGIMGKHTKELERRATILDECEKEIKQRAGVIIEYSDRINELVSAFKESNIQTPDGVADNKTV